jgi:hypothetical protein
MKFNTNYSNFTQIAASEPQLGLERSKREVPPELESEGPPKLGCDLDCVAVAKRRQSMNKLLQYPIQVNANLGATLKHLGWLSWSRNPTAPELDARTQYDIGENDCRPQPGKPAKAYSASLEAMLNRSI